MGNQCMKFGSNARDREDAMNDAIEQRIIDAKELERMKLKLLLLGAGESGKTTLFKQMKINFVKDYAKANLLGEKSNIISAFFSSFQSLLKCIVEKYGTLGNADLDEMSEVLYSDANKRMHRTLSKQNVQFMHDVWNSPSAQEIWENRNKYQVTDSLGYFCESLDRMASSKYTPTEEDFLRCRVRSVGIVEQTFKHRGVTMVVVDVGGQRSERSKWMQSFDQVTSVLYVAAISEFDQKLFEDTNVDRMTESVELFHKTLKYRVFQDTPIMLFLNKHDLFLEKLERIKNRDENFDSYFPELGLGKNYEGAEDIVLQHLKDKFMEEATNPQRIHIHVTTALDKDKFTVVFTGISKIILSSVVSGHFQPA